MDAPALRTERLVMLPLGPADIDEIAALRSDAAVMAHVAGGAMNRARSIDSLARSERCWRSNGWGLWAIRDAETGGLVGEGGLQSDSLVDGALAEFVITLGRRSWGRGYGAEAAHAIIDDAWTRFSGDIIHAIVVPDNVASSALLRSIGFTHTGTHPVGGQPHEIWVISRAE